MDIVPSVINYRRIEHIHELAEILTLIEMQKIMEVMKQEFPNTWDRQLSIHYGKDKKYLKIKIAHNSNPRKYILFEKFFQHTRVVVGVQHYPIFLSRLWIKHKHYIHYFFRDYIKFFHIALHRNTKVRRSHLKQYTLKLYLLKLIT